jgi:hypothetical protein
MPEKGILMRNSQDQILDLVVSCCKDPLRFVKLFFPWGEPGELRDQDGPDIWQKEILSELGQGLLNIDQAIKIAVASGHGIGKSALVSWIILWAVSTMEDTKGIITANTETQLKTKTWAELAKWKRLLLNEKWFEMTATSLFSVDPAHEKTWRVDMVPWNEARPEAFAGLHNKGKRSLIIFDEASAIHDIIWEVSEGAMTDAGTERIWCCFGNPTKNVGRFKECFGLFKHRWKTYQIDSRKCKMVNKEQINQWVEDYGEDSDFVRVRVKGEFPRADSNQLIPQDLIFAARKRQVDVPESLPKILSLDVARKGGAKTVPCLRQGRRMKILGKWRGLTIDQSTERFIKLIDEIRPDIIVIDGDGIGASVGDLINVREYNLKNGKNILFYFHGAVPAFDPSKYHNRRTEIWCKLKKWLEGEVQIDDDPEIENELVSVEHFFDKLNRFQLESKKDMSAASPDLGDAMAMTLAIEVNEQTLPGKLKNTKTILPKKCAPSKGGWMS